MLLFGSKFRKKEKKIQPFWEEILIGEVQQAFMLLQDLHDTFSYDTLNNLDKLDKLINWINKTLSPDLHTVAETEQKSFGFLLMYVVCTYALLYVCTMN